MAEAQRVCLSIVSLPKQINTTLTLLPTRFTGKHLHGCDICHSPLWHNRVFAWLPPVSDNLRKLTLHGWCEVLIYHIVGRQIKALWHQQLCCCETSNWLAHDSPITGGWRAPGQAQGMRDEVDGVADWPTSNLKPGPNRATQISLSVSRRFPYYRERIWLWEHPNLILIFWI